MSARPLDRTLRGAGAVLLATIVVAVAWSARSSPEARWLTGAQAFGGTIEHFGDDAIVVSTSTAGPRSIRIGPETVVTESGARSTVAALRPGRFVAVRGTARSLAGPMSAREILVWGGDS